MSNASLSVTLLYHERKTKRNNILQIYYEIFKVLRGFCPQHHHMIPGSKGHKSDASLLAGGFLNLGPAKNMSKKPFFEEK